MNIITEKIVQVFLIIHLNHLNYLKLKWNSIFYNIINKLVNCKFISDENNLLLFKLKNIIEIKNKSFVNSINMTHL